MSVLLIIVLFVKIIISQHLFKNAEQEVYVLNNTIKSFTKLFNAFESGNLLVVQPNEVYTKNFLVEMTKKGKVVHRYTFNDTIKSNPMDIKFYNGNIYVLCVMDGVFLVNKSADVIRQFGKGAWPLKGEHLFAMDFDPDGNLYIINDGTNQKIQAKIMKFDKDENYIGVIIDEPWPSHPQFTEIFAGDKYLWISEGASQGDQSVITRYTKDGTLYDTIVGEHHMWIYVGIAGYDGKVYAASEMNPKDPKGVNNRIYVMDQASGKLLEEWDLGYVGGCPSAICFGSDSNGDTELYLLNSDPWTCVNSTVEHIQVYDLDGNLIRQFGGHSMGSLAQSFQFTMIP